jgi:hypothetical protein
LSSSEEVDVRFLELDNAGEPGFFPFSTTTDFGLYFGRPDELDELPGRGLSAEDRAGSVDCGVALGGTAEESSVEFRLEIDPGASELLLRAVIVFESGVRERLEGGGECLESSEARGFVPIPLDLCKSFPAFLATLSFSLVLFITSANALPTEAKFNDCRIELRVEGFVRVPLLSDMI